MTNYLSIYSETFKEFNDAGNPGSLEIYLFKAQNDEEALIFALAFADMVNKGRYITDLNLSSLVKVDIISVPCDARREVTVTPNLEKKVTEATFTRLPYKVLQGGFEVEINLTLPRTPP